MSGARLHDIPVRSADAGAPGAGAFGGSCSGSEPFALMVLGDSMQPEFVEGEIIIVEPDGMAADGSFVVARWQDEWLFRQLRLDGGWCLRALNPAYPKVRIPDLAAIRGVVIQKSRPGRRRESKRYVD